MNDSVKQSPHWYDKFVKDDDKKAHAGVPRKKERAHPSPKAAPEAANSGAPFAASKAQRKSGEVLCVKPMFDAGLDDKAQAALEDFDGIVQNVFPCGPRQERKAKSGIKGLSHSLTDEREERRRGYMNDASTLSPYARYFTWWNLVRLTRLFAAMSGEIALEDCDVCLDCGSGPLTAVIALYLACPALRKKHLTWVCMDISQNALNLGKDLFTAVADMVRPHSGEDTWQIVKVKARAGDEIKEKAALVTCVNLLNEVQESEHLTAEETAQKYSAVLSRYTRDGGTLLVVEPGVPPQAHVLSLMREAFLERDWRIISPCTHALKCPMRGERETAPSPHTAGRESRIVQKQGKSKWCNFAFSTLDAPERLLDLSADAGLAKRRAVMSYLLLHKTKDGGIKKRGGEQEEGILRLRIASDPIYLPGYRTGYYACSPLGLALVIDTSGRRYASGDEVALRLKCKAQALERDKKTGAVMLYL